MTKPTGYATPDCPIHRAIAAFALANAAYGDWRDGRLRYDQEVKLGGARDSQSQRERLFDVGGRLDQAGKAYQAARVLVGLALSKIPGHLEREVRVETKCCGGEGCKNATS